MIIANRCFYCHRPFGLAPFGSDVPLRKTRDHVIPVSKSGPKTKDNIVDCCQHCNNAKRDLTVAQFEMMLSIMENKANFSYMGGAFHNSLIPKIPIMLSNLRKLMGSKNATDLVSRAYPKRYDFY